MSMTESAMQMTEEMNTGVMAQTQDSCTVLTSCVMSISQHIQQWQFVFMTDLNLFVSALALSLFLLTPVFPLVLLARGSILWLYQRYRNYRREHYAYRLYNIFLEFFSRGILQPKIFA